MRRKSALFVTSDQQVIRHVKAIHVVFSLVIVLLTLACLPAPARAGQSEAVPVACPAEPPDKLVPLKYDDRTSGCQINFEGDTDQFIFTGATGDRIRPIVSRTSGTVCLRLEIFDPGNVKLADRLTCGDDLSVENLNPLPKTGTYTIIVSDFNEDGTGAYTLHLHKIPPVFDAPNLAYGALPLRDQLDFGTDLDFFDFQGHAGTQTRLNVSRESGSYCARLELFKPDKAKLADRLTCGDDLLVDVSLPQSGTYVVVVSDFNLDGSGNYDLTLVCLTGPCPSRLPPPDLEGYEHLKGNPLAGRKVCVTQPGVATKCTTTNRIGYWKFPPSTLVTGKSFQVLINGPVVSSAFVAALGEVNEESVTPSDGDESEEAEEDHVPEMRDR